MGRPVRSASHEVLSLSAPAHRAARSGVATSRTIPLRLLSRPLLQRKCFANAEASQPALAVFRSHPRPPQWPAGNVSRRGSCIAPFLIAMFRYPPPRGSAAPPEPFRPGDAPGVLFPSQSCSRTVDFRAFPLVFPHVPSVNFHLDVLFFSRDRPTDSLFRGSGENCLASAASFHPLRTQTRPIAEVHLGFWVLIHRAVRFSAFISLAARSCLGIRLLQVRRTPASACPCVLETRLSHQPPHGRFRPAIRSWVS